MTQRIEDTTNWLLSAKGKYGDLRRTVYKLWQQHEAEGTLPTSGRFLFYELVALGVIDKTTTERTDGKKGRRPDQDLNQALTALREGGLIPWDDIVDETRELTQWLVYDSIKDAMREKWETARLNLWGNDAPPMILCESRSLRGVLERLAQEYQAPIAATNGQAAGFLHTEMGPALKPGQIVLYFGDLDKSGGDIEENTRRVLEKITGLSLPWERVAITQEQADRYNLVPISKLDKRTKSYHDAIETEALGQSRIVALLRTRLRQLMPDTRRKNVLERQKAERDKIGRQLGYIKDKK